MSGSFNVFEPPTLRDVKVGYISTDRGYISGVGLWDANVYAKKNPGTTFIFSTREKTQYLNINEVNKLTPDDLPADAQKCKGASIFTPDSEDSNPKIIFAGGGGVGAQANPIIGRDGSLLGVDLISGGFGYKYPPQVSIDDPTGISAGAVIRAGIGSTAIKWETYEDEDEFEEYFPPHIRALAPPNVGFGSVYSNGKNIGAWNPHKYINPQETPFEATVKQYMKDLRSIQNPWWTTRTEAPNKVTGNNKTTKTFYKVHHWAWGASTGINDEIDNLYIKLFGRRGEPSGLAYWKKLRESGQSLKVIEQDMKRQPEWKEVCFGKCKPVMNDVTYKFGTYWEYDKDNFMNSYAISPVPMSKSKGSDFAGRWYTFEWDAVEFPYDGEYDFRVQCDNEARFFLDNEAVSEFKIGAGGAAGSVLSDPLHFKETIKKGQHSFRLELYNYPKMEDVNIQEDQITTRQEIQVAGGDFMKKSNGYYLAVGGNEETELVLKLDYNDNPRTAGTAITKLTIPNTNGPDLVLEREKDSNGNFKTKGSVSAKGVFRRSELGYGPFILEGNSGSSRLTKVNAVYGPNSNRYGTIEFLDSHGSDTNGSVTIISAKNLQESRTIIKAPTSSESKKLKTVFNTIDYIKKANRKLWRTNINNKSGFKNEYGICPFDTLNTLPDNPYAGTHEIRWNNVNFPVTGNYIIEIAVDDNVTLQIGDQVEIRKEGYVIQNGRIKSTGTLKEVRSIKQGTYNIVAALEQIPGGRFGWGKIRGKDGKIVDAGSGKGLNPMALAVNITTAFTKEERVKRVDWNENPMGVAMTIEAPAPPIPQQPKPVQKGRCPANPFWTTRFPGGTSQWHPVFVKGWSKFLNKHAMSPVPPYDTDTTSGGGISFENEWTVDIPYDGFYKLKGEADDISTFWVNGTEVLSTSRRENKVRGEKKFFLSKGSATIRVAVENYLFEEKQLIDQKIFSTADWVNAGAESPANIQTVDFKVTTATAFVNSIDIKGLFYKEGPEVVAGDITPPQQAKPVTAEVSFIKKGDQYFMSVTGNDLIEVTFDFRYHVDDVNRGGGLSVRGVTIQTEGAPLTFRRTDGPRMLLDGWPGRGGSVIKKATFKKGKEYPITFSGLLSGATAPEIWSFGSVDNPKGIAFYDNDTSEGATAGPDLIGDVRAHFNATNVRQLSEPPLLDSPPPKSKLRQLNGKPVITKEVEIGKEYIVEIKNAGQGLMGNTPAPLAALKTDGGVLMVEDIPNVAAGAQGGVTFDDLVCTASHGRFYDIKKNTCKYKVERKAPTASGTVTGGTIRDGVTYEGPRLATYAKSKDGLGAMISPYFKDPEEIQDKTWKMKWTNVNFPETGKYDLKLHADDELRMRIDGKEVGVDKVGGGVSSFTFNIATKGSKTVELDLSNIRVSRPTWERNPVVGAALITKKMSVSVKVDGKIKTKSWKENPVGVSGILIPPPCPQVVGGKGVVVDPRPICPGNGFKPPDGPGYPVALILERIDVDTPGINYNPDDPVEIDGPADGHICEMDSYGRVKKICITSQVGFTEYPSIRINSPTGTGFRGIPVMSSVRDPIVSDPDKLLQVTDLVGVKQTGYYDGRAYYGAIFYKDGVKYAGYYETAGQLVQIYDTMQESIDAQVTTPASAILRQGTDISSDNPRLDIPGTPDNLT